MACGGCENAVSWKHPRCIHKHLAQVYILVKKFQGNTVQKIDLDHINLNKLVS
jgi:hypothetical protein